MRKGDAGIAVGIAFIAVVFGLPGQPWARALVNGWPIGAGLLVSGIVLARRWPGWPTRLLAGVGLAWAAYVGLLVLLVVAWLVLVGIKGP